LATGYTFACSHCGHTVGTSGPWEFYRDSQGKVQPYGHPVPFSEEAEKAGVWGLLGDVFCPSCNKTEKIILEEYVRPVENSFKVWARKVTVLPKYKTAPCCPDCGGPLYLGDLEGQSCPLCGKGCFEGGAAWMS